MKSPTEKEKNVGDVEVSRQMVNMRVGMKKKLFHQENRVEENLNLDLVQNRMKIFKQLTKRLMKVLYKLKVLKVIVIANPR